MQIDTTLRDNVLVVTVLESRIDAAGAVAFKDAMREAVDGHDGRVLLDMGSVEFLDSSGLGALVGVMKLLNGRPLELAAPGEVILKVLRLTRMDKVFVVHPDLDSALAPRDAA